MEIRNGIIISANPYKDKNLICSLLCEDEIISFEVLSFFNSKKGYTNDIQVLNFGEFELYKGPTSYFKLKNYKIERSLYNSVYADSDLLMGYEYLKEILIKVPPVDEFYKYSKLIKLTIEKILLDKSNINVYLLLFVSFYLRFIGYSIANVLEKEVDLALHEYTKESGEVLGQSLNEYLKFKEIYNKLFKNKYLDALKIVESAPKEMVRIVLINVSRIFERLVNIKINSLQFF